MFIPVHDPDAALGFYRDALGLEVRNDVAVRRLPLGHRRRPGTGRRHRPVPAARRSFAGRGRRPPVARDPGLAAGRDLPLRRPRHHVREGPGVGRRGAAGADVPALGSRATPRSATRRATSSASSRPRERDHEDDDMPAIGRALRSRASWRDRRRGDQGAGSPSRGSRAAGDAAHESALKDMKADGRTRSPAWGGTSRRNGISPLWLTTEGKVPGQRWPGSAALVSRHRATAAAAGDTVLIIWSARWSRPHSSASLRGPGSHSRSRRHASPCSPRRRIAGLSVFTCRYVMSRPASHDSAAPSMVRPIPARWTAGRTPITTISAASWAAPAQRQDAARSPVHCRHDGGMCVRRVDVGRDRVGEAEPFRQSGQDLGADRSGAPVLHPERQSGGTTGAGTSPVQARAHGAVRPPAARLPSRDRAACACRACR